MGAWIANLIVIRAGPSLTLALDRLLSDFDLECCLSRDSKRHLLNGVMRSTEENAARKNTSYGLCLETLADGNQLIAVMF